MTAPTGLSSDWGSGAGSFWQEGNGGVSHISDGTKLDFSLPYKGITLPATYTTSVDVRIDDPTSGAHWAGVAYNIQDDKNFYVFRITVKGSLAYYQVLKRVNGEWKGVAPTDKAFGEFESHDGFYTVQVSGNPDGSHHCSISFGATKLVDLPNVPDPNGKTYTGGTAGLYAASHISTLADFRLETTSDATAAK